MISWRTTVTPATELRFSFFSKASNSGEFGGGNIFSPAGTFNHTYELTEEQITNWSGVTTFVTNIINESQTNQTFGEVNEENTDLISGVTNQAYNTTIVESGATPLTDTRNIETSTTQSVSLNKSRTSLGTSAAFKYSTSSNNESAVVFNVFTTETAATVQSTYSTSSERTTTTTLSQTEQNPNFFATVYQINSTNEVLWCLGVNTKNTFSGAYSAASDVAVSSTRFTAMPPTETAPVIQASNTSSSSQVIFTRTSAATFATRMTSTLSELSGAVTMTVGVEQVAETTVVASSDQLPWVTSAGYGNVFTPETSEVFYNAFFSQDVQALGIARRPRYASRVRTTDSFFGEATNSTGATTFVDWTSRGVLLNDTNVRGSRSSSFRASDGGVGIFVTSWGGTGFALPEQRLGTSIAYPESVKLGLFGAADSAGSVAGFYSAPFSGTIGPNYLAGHHRDISHTKTIFPGTFEIYADTATGTISFSKLSATVTYSTATETSAEKSTTSFVVGAQGDAQIARISYGTNVVFGGTLAPYESKAETIPPGVYRKTQGDSTEVFSTSGTVRSFTGSSGGPTFCLEPLSFLVPGQAVDAAVIWTATRNRTATP
jgi:hypothetical protein